MMFEERTTHHDKKRMKPTITAIWNGKTREKLNVTENGEWRSSPLCVEFKAQGFNLVLMVGLATLNKNKGFSCFLEGEGAENCEIAKRHFFCLVVIGFVVRPPGPSWQAPSKGECEDISVSPTMYHTQPRIMHVWSQNGCTGFFP